MISAERNFRHPKWY